MVGRRVKCHDVGEDTVYYSDHTILRIDHAQVTGVGCYPL